MTRLLVVIPAWVLGDGAIPPPALGDQVHYPLAFHERGPADYPDPTAQTLTADADSYAEPWERRDHTGGTWHAHPTTLVAADWRAHWSAPRRVHGHVALVGRLMVDPLLDEQHTAGGTVTGVHVISEEIQAATSTRSRNPVLGSVQLRPVAISPRWFDNGPRKQPTSPGWHSYSELAPDRPYRRETGVLVTLEPTPRPQPDDTSPTR